MHPAEAVKIQEKIWNQMTDEELFALWAKLWRLGKALNPKHFVYDRDRRSTQAARRHRRHSQP